MARPEIVVALLDGGVSNRPSVAYSPGGAVLTLHAIRQIPYAGGGGNAGSIRHFARADKKESRGGSIAS